MKRKTKTALIAYLFLTPAILGLLVYTIYPIIGVLGVSLTEWSGLESPHFVGIQNYIDIFFNDNYFISSVFSTLYFALGAVITGIIYSFSIALLLNRKIPFQGFWRSVFFIPYVVPIMGTSVVWTWMYESNFGVFNYLLSLIGVGKIHWLADVRFAAPSLIVMTMWTAGNLIVIFMAGLQNVPTTYLEAVEIDGGNTWHKFKYVTLPLMSPIIFFNFLTSIVVNLQSFVPPYAMTKGGPNNATLFMVYLIYREGFMRNNFGHASALSLIFFVFVIALTLLIFFISRKWIFYEGK